MPFFQTELQIARKSKGFHLITKDIIEALDIQQVQVGLLHVFCKHTSCSLTLNENADPDVRTDMEHVLDSLLDHHSFLHTDEGPDDMPAHIKSSLLGHSLTIPITRGRLNLGTWQGIWLGEHRLKGGTRTLVLTVQS